jgi:hypothetical protein
MDVESSGCSEFGLLRVEVIGQDAAHEGRYGRGGNRAVEAAPGARGLLVAPPSERSFGGDLRGERSSVLKIPRAPKD